MHLLRTKLSLLQRFCIRCLWSERIVVVTVCCYRLLLLLFILNVIIVLMLFSGVLLNIVDSTGR